MVWVVKHLLHLGAYASAFSISWDQENEARGAGIHTFPPIAVACCGFVLAASEVLGRGSQSHARRAPGREMGIPSEGAL